MSDKLGFLDSLFDVDGDGQVNEMDFINLTFFIIQEAEKEQTRRKRETLNCSTEKS